MLTERQVQEAIANFAKTISSQPLGLAHHRPDPAALHTNCVANALAFAEKHGGQVRFGWHFLFRMSPDFGHYLIATNDAVWHNPVELQLVDVTPLHTRRKHQPVTQDGDLLFLVDDDAKPSRRKTWQSHCRCGFTLLATTKALRNTSPSCKSKSATNTIKRMALVSRDRDRNC